MTNNDEFESNINITDDCIITENENSEHLVSNSLIPTKKTKKQKDESKKGLVIFIVVLIIAFFIIAYNIFAVKNNTNTQNSTMDQKLLTSFQKDFIAVLHIEGTIENSNTTYDQDFILNTIRDLAHNEKNLGILLYINSPGGGVYQADEVYNELLNYKQHSNKYGNKKLVFSYMDSLAASGGYYIACASNIIYANRNTLTGSIGVIAGQSIDLTELMDKYGVKMTTITAGKNKNMFSIDEPVTPEQKAIMQSIADECYDQFTEIVSTSRNIDIETVRNLADGRIYTAKQALENKLIDSIKFYSEAKDEIYNSVFYEDELQFIEYEYKAKKTLFESMMGVFSNFNKQTQAPYENLLEIIKENKSFPYPAYYYIK